MFPSLPTSARQARSKGETPMEAINKMRAECLRYYVGRRHSPDHADLIVPKDETEVRRIHEYIQKEKEWASDTPSNPPGIQFEQDDNT